MAEQPALPGAYRLAEHATRAATISALPRNVFFEVTNRCNLLCATCPHTNGAQEAPRDLSLEELVAIAEAFPELERAVLHGIGEPLLNPALPEMICYLKARGVNVLFNSNGLALTEGLADRLVASGLDEYRLSLDAATPGTYEKIRGLPLFDRVVANVRRLVDIRERADASSPHISIWCMAMKDNIEELPDLIRLAANLHIPEVYLQRLTYDVAEGEHAGLAGPEHALFGRLEAREAEIIARCEELSGKLGLAFKASGATSPVASLQSSDAAERPWSACLRPWTSAYVTANGNALPCCISPFATHRYSDLIMGNVFQAPFAEIWNGERYQRWREALLSDSPPETCAGCGIFWSL